MCIIVKLFEWEKGSERKRREPHIFLFYKDLTTYENAKGLAEYSREKQGRT